MKDGEAMRSAKKGGAAYGELATALRRAVERTEKAASDGGISAITAEMTEEAGWEAVVTQFRLACQESEKLKRMQRAVSARQTALDQVDDLRGHWTPELRALVFGKDGIRSKLRDIRIVIAELSDPLQELLLLDEVLSVLSISR